MNRRTFFGAVMGALSWATIGKSALAQGERFTGNLQAMGGLGPPTPFSLAIDGMEVSLLDAGKRGEWNIARLKHCDYFAEVSWKPGKGCLLINYCQVMCDQSRDMPLLVCDTDFQCWRIVHPLGDSIPPSSTSEPN